MLLELIESLMLLGCSMIFELGCNSRILPSCVGPMLLPIQIGMRLSRLERVMSGTLSYVT